VTDAEMEEFIEIMREKYGNNAALFGETEAERIAGVIAGVVADTQMCVSGAVPIERWRQP